MSDEARRDEASRTDSTQTAPASRRVTARHGQHAAVKPDAAVAQAPRSTGLDLQGSAIGVAQVRGAPQPGVLMGQATATAGADGSRNITVQKFWMPVGNDMPAGYDVGTLTAHGLEVTLEQLAYRKTYTGTGSVKTGLTPVAPIGTTGRMIARDLVTGETLEQPWTWHTIGGSPGGSGFWAALKRALWKG